MTSLFRAINRNKFHREEASRSVAILRFVLITIIVLLTVNSRAEVGAVIREPTNAELKSLELWLDSNRFLVTLASAAIAYFLTQGQTLVALFRQKKSYFQKLIFVISPMSLLISIFILLWDQRTATNQLRNGFINFGDFFGEGILLVTLGVGLISFLICAGFIWVREAGQKK